jgi:phenylpropionate dioxygenase-like ring-hydroxylating dioxygenase large terminal subunit
MGRYAKPAEGSWTEHYPELGTGPMNSEDSVSPEYYELEREAVFKKAWLNVGRVEELPRNGSFFTKELVAANTSVIVARDLKGEIHAFHNICRHRGNKLVWTDFPNEETRGNCRQFTCKYHMWSYDLDGALTRVPQEDEFFDFDKATYGLIPVHCDVWNGFIFVNVADEPEQSLTDFLGPMVHKLDTYPFHEMSERYAYRAAVGSNWKLFMDAFQEFYHAPYLHGGQTPRKFTDMIQEFGFEAPYYEIDGPHRVVSTGGVRGEDQPKDMIKPIEEKLRSGLFGAWEHPELSIDEQAVPGVNPGGSNPWGLDSYNLWPNFVILIWAGGWYLTYHYWPTAVNSHVFEANLYFVPAKDATERLAHELARVSFKDYGLQDANTLEATQKMLESRVITEYLLNDQEVLCRHLHKESRDAVEAYKRELEGAKV